MVPVLMEEEVAHSSNVLKVKNSVINNVCTSVQLHYYLKTTYLLKLIYYFEFFFSLLSSPQAPLDQNCSMPKNFKYTLILDALRETAVWLL